MVHSGNTKSDGSTRQTSQIRITNAVISEQIDKNQKPVGVGETFSSGRKDLYYYVNYEGGIPNKTAFSFFWYRGNQQISNFTHILKYERGFAWANLPYNYTKGAYEVRLLINNQIVRRNFFRIGDSKEPIKNQGIQEKIPSEPIRTGIQRDVKGIEGSKEPLQDQGTHKKMPVESVKTAEDEFKEIYNDPKLEKYLEFIRKYPSYPNIVMLKYKIISAETNLPSQYYWDNTKKNSRGYWEIVHKNLVNLIWVPPGKIRIQRKLGLKDETGEDIEVKGFWIGKYEVTVDQYRQYCNLNNLIFSNLSLLGTQGNEPVRNISWDQASKFCEWLGCRLPTEFEWERVAVAREDADRFPYGSNFNSFTGDGGSAYVRRVGSSRENKFGIYDILGNVEEWCQDWYRVDILSSQGQQLYKVLRGGSFQDKPFELIVYRRNFMFPSYQKETNGFRVAMD